MPWKTETTYVEWSYIISKVSRSIKSRRSRRMEYTDRIGMPQGLG